MILLYLLPLFLAALVLQTSLLPWVLPPWFLAGFSLPLVATVHLAISRGRGAGLASGLVLGYAQDLLSGGFLGVNGGALILGGYTGGFLREKLYIRSFGQRLGAVTGAVASAVLWKMAVAAVFSLPSPGLFSSVPLLTFLLNVLTAMAATGALERLETRLKLRSEGLSEMEI